LIYNWFLEKIVIHRIWSILEWNRKPLSKHATTCTSTSAAWFPQCTKKGNHLHAWYQINVQFILKTYNKEIFFNFCHFATTLRWPRHVRWCEIILIYIRPVYTTSVLGTAPLKMGTVPKLPLRYLLVYTTIFCRHTFMIGTVPIGKRHLYFPFTTVYFRINMSDRNRNIYLYLLERRRVLYEPKIEGKTQLNTRKVL
jgi:hypothetical protein